MINQRWCQWSAPRSVLGKVPMWSWNGGWRKISVLGEHRMVGSIVGKEDQIYYHMCCIWVCFSDEKKICNLNKENQKDYTPTHDFVSTLNCKHYDLLRFRITAIPFQSGGDALNPPPTPQQGSQRWRRWTICFVPKTNDELAYYCWWLKSCTTWDG